MTERAITPDEWVSESPELTGEPTIAHDLAVQAALYKAAIGGTKWREMVSNGHTYVVEEEVRPDPKAAERWLQARRPAQWREPEPDASLPRSISITVTVHGQPRVTIGQVIEGEVTAPGLIRQDGGGGGS